MIDVSTQAEDRFIADFAQDLAFQAADYLTADHPRLHEIYREMLDLGDDFFAMAKDEQKRRRARYETLRDELLQIVGADAHVNLVDPWMWDAYSDCYKDDVGFRPKGHHSYLQVKAYFDRRIAEGTSWVEED